jgi:transcriptional regulator with XRE-family HTH domain
MAKDLISDSQRQIAAKIGVSKGAVQRTLKGSEN